MFKFLKRLTGAPAKPPARKPGSPAAKAPRPARRLTGPSPLDTLPTPEVEELTDESAWDQWEHSQMELDSRMGPLSAYDTIRVKDPAPSRAADLDPFEAVRRKN